MTDETNSKELFFYSGKAKPVFAPERHILPTLNLEQARDPEHYVAPNGLRDAVNVALTLGLPLLITGEPGVGKSSLAHSLHRALGNEGDLLHFTVKSDTRDTELFYNYDTLGRFHAVHGQINGDNELAKEKAKNEADPRRFIRYQALGLAILQAKGRDNIPADIMTSDDLKNFSKQRRRAVVLIDEIDKAPRDMPNDILNEIERMEFRIPELFREQAIKLDKEDEQYRPIVIITSNSERPLPEAFLRRCLYYDLAMPKFKEDLADNSEDVSVEAIVESRFGKDIFDNKPYLFKAALSYFKYLRSDKNQKQLNRKPSLAEFLDWLRYLDKSHLATPLDIREDLEISVKATLLKHPDDQQNYKQQLEDWKTQAPEHVTTS